MGSDAIGLIEPTCGLNLRNLASNLAETSGDALSRRCVLALQISVHGLSIDGCGHGVMGQLIQSSRTTTRVSEIAPALQAEDASRARKAARAHVRNLSRSSLDNLL